MLKHIVILSGPVGSGKTTLAEALGRFAFQHYKSKEYLKELGKHIESERGALQAFGELLDRRTKGQWVVDGLLKWLDKWPKAERLVVDAARIAPQIDAVRTAFPHKVIHIHLTAPTAILSERYRGRPEHGIKELGSYEAVQKNPTERRVHRLARIADIVIDTHRNTREDVLTRAAAHLGLYGREYLRLVDVMIGGQYGSEGKGQIAAYLAKEYEYLVRVGGPNAGHSVSEGNGKYIFHQLPSGTRATEEPKLIIAPGAVIDVDKLLVEIGECDVEPSRLAVDPQTMVISAKDRKDEQRLVRAIGSTGQGVGFATARRIRGRDGSVKLARDIAALRPYIRDTCLLLEEAFSRESRVLIEGTQGTGLSLYHGHYPHVTSRDTTVAGCLAEAGVSPSRVRRIVMVCRSYPIRVQNPTGDGQTSGFMSQEISLEEVAARSGLDLPDLQQTETTSTTKKKRRIAEFDWVLLRKSATLNGPTDIALTFVDYLDKANRKARRFEQLTSETIRFIEEIERVTASSVSLISTCFHFRGIIDRRAW